MDARRRYLLKCLSFAPMGALGVPLTSALGAEPSPLPDWVPPAGHISSISLNKLSSVNPCAAYPCVYSGVMGQKGVFAYSGGAFAPDYGRYGAYVMTGGGHTDYHGNEIYLFPLESRRWVLLTQPYPSNGLSKGRTFGSSAATPAEAANSWPNFDWTYGDYDGAIPEQMHTYDFVDVLPPPAGGGPKGSLIRLIGLACGNGSFPFRGTHVCDLSTGKWSRYALSDYAGVAGGSAYDAQRKRFYMLCGASTSWTNNMRYLDTANRTWTTYETRNDVLVDIEAAAAIFPLGDLFISSEGRRAVPPRLWALPLEDRFPPAWVQLKTTEFGPTREDGSSAGFGIEYCPLDGCFYCVPGGHGSDLWRLRPPKDYLGGTWTWTREELVGKVSIERGGYVYNRLRWAPAVRSFVWVDGVDGAVQLIRPNSAL